MKNIKKHIKTEAGFDHIAHLHTTQKIINNFYIMLTNAESKTF